MSPILIDYPLRISVVDVKPSVVVDSSTVVKGSSVGPSVAVVKDSSVVVGPSVTVVKGSSVVVGPSVPGDKTSSVVVGSSVVVEGSSTRVVDSVAKRSVVVSGGKVGPVPIGGRLPLTAILSSTV